MSEYDKEPLSRVEEILDETSSGTEYDKEPLSRVEFRLKEVMAKIDGLVPDATVYKPAGSVTFANLPSPSKSTLGYVYDVSDAFTTTSDFKEGSGKKYPAGTNVAIVDIGTDENPIYKYDVLSGFIDMDNYVEKEAGKGLSSNDFTNEAKNKLDDLENYDDTEIKNDISDLSDAVEDKVDKVAGKGLSTNDFTDAAKNKLAGLVNYDDTEIKNDISELETGKVDKVNGKSLSTNDYTDADKALVANSPITTTSTTSPISTANGKPRAITIYGKSEIVDGTIKSAGEGWSVVDLGTLNWSYSPNYPTPMFSTDAVALGCKTSSDKFVCELYQPELNAWYTPNNDMKIASGASNLNITNLNYTDATAFKSAMSGVLLCYQLADPTQGNCIAIKTDNGSGINGTMAVFTTGTPLRGIPDTDVRDVMEWDGSSGEVTKKCDEIDLGTLNWTYLSETTRFISGTIAQSVKRPNTDSDVVNFLCPNYSVTSLNDLKDSGENNIIACGDTGVVSIRNTTYTDPTAFKTAMAGVKLVYELATPTTTPLTTAENESIAGLKTYAPQTTVTINDNPEFEVEAYANTANGQAVQSLESNIKSQIDEVKNEKNHFCYSYKIDLSDSNPATCVKPHFDTRYGCDNFSYTSAKMNYTTGVFDYGSWEGFIRRIARPCMLKYDGTVDYYLDPDDYSKKITGEASDVADVNYQGNAMVELEKLYFKRYTYNGIQYCFISDRKLDKSFHCYAHHDKYGKELDYIYRACYDGMYDGTRLRSISGIDYHNLNALTAGYIMSNTTRQEEMNFAKANNVSTEQGEGWNILHKSEWDYINDILVLISMSTDTQGTFGRGRDGGYVSTSDTGIISTGTMDTKGLFWGKNDSTAGVKVLGIENHWANIFKSCAGWFNDKGTQKVKYTYGTEDGSTGEGYNITADGYISITGATPTKGDESTSGGGYITAWQYGEYGILPYETISGANNKYLCDYIWFNNTATCFALVGGSSYDGLSCGAFSSDLYDGAGLRAWSFGAALSYKPLSAA